MAILFRGMLIKQQFVQMLTKLKVADIKFFNIPPQEDYISVEKGFVYVNGVSLTVVNSKHGSFQVAIITFTYQVTNFHKIKN